MLETFFNKAVDLQACNFIKKIEPPANLQSLQKLFAKFLRKPSFKNSCEMQLPEIILQGFSKLLFYQTCYKRFQLEEWDSIRNLNKSHVFFIPKF